MGAAALTMRVALLLTGFLLSAAALAQAQRTPFQARCEDTLRKTSVQLTSSTPGYSIDDSVSYRALTQMKGRTARRAWVLGLTRAESHAAIRTSGSILEDRAAAYECITPQINVELSYAPITVYVGREFRPGTCAYNHILQHELRHVRSYLDHMAVVERTVRSALEQRFRSQPLYAPRGQSNALLGREIDARWIPYIKSELGKVEARQAAIDSPAEYARLSRICKGEVQSILKAHRSTP